MGGGVHRMPLLSKADGDTTARPADGQRQHGPHGLHGSGAAHAEIPLLMSQWPTPATNVQPPDLHLNISRGIRCPRVACLN
eukprot:1044168-Lingulodinium_polyedra.AAC.1